MIMVRYWKNAGMLSIGNTKPESRLAGISPDMIATCIATSWLRVSTEISSPWAR